MTMEAPEEVDFNLREWAFKARVSRENTISRRFSASNIIRSSFRDEDRSFRSNFTISSTASSPGYSLKDEIDPTTYSFTTALRALQARSSYHSWESLSPNGFVLNSKWNDAEKYICNPLSGEVPVECLSAKTLSARSFRGLTNRITMSAPLVYSSRQIHNKPFISTEEDVMQFPTQEKKTRDVGTQSTPPDMSSSSPSPASTPCAVHRSINATHSTSMLNSHLEVKGREKDEENREKEKKKKEEEMCRCRCRCREGGCLPWMRKRQREKHKPRNKNILLLLRFKGC